MTDIVNHPDYYTDGGIETIDFIEAKELPYHLGNAVKYISRAGKKCPEKTIEDLRPILSANDPKTQDPMGRIKNPRAKIPNAEICCIVGSCDPENLCAKYTTLNT